MKAKHNVDSEGVLYPKLVIQKSAGKNEQIFLLITNKDEKIWVYPDKVFVGETEVYNRDMFLDPKSPTDEEAQMLRMSKGSDLDILMKKFGRFPGRILERVMSGMFVEEYVSANKEKVIVLIS
ncbi:hypothetical protein [Cronobacter phage EspYZU12]|nr:hypothetical protein [Cronobacter phage EspYZU12]